MNSSEEIFPSWPLGSAPPDGSPNVLIVLFDDVGFSDFEFFSENMFSIGLIGNVPQPVVVDKDMRNVPEKGIHSWEPGAFFGIYRPDTFWWDR